MQWRSIPPGTRLFAQQFVQAQIKEISKLHVTGLCEGNSPVNSPHKGSVKRKMFPFDDVIMILDDRIILYSRLREIWQQDGLLLSEWWMIWYFFLEKRVEKNDASPIHRNKVMYDKNLIWSSLNWIPTSQGLIIINLTTTCQPFNSKIGKQTKRRMIFPIKVRMKLHEKFFTWNFTHNMI